MIKFKTDAGRVWSIEANIEPVEIEKETETSIWIKGCRQNKVSQYTVYHDTWDLAKAFLVETTSRKLSQTMDEVKRAEVNYMKVCQLQKP